MSEELVLVTGGSGFVGAHCIVQLLEAGYRVRTTLRSLSREAEVREMVRVGGAAARDRLEFCVADLAHDAGWTEAVEGCAYVLHVASPFPLGVPKHEDELIVPARDGALRVLRAARDAGVRRVVMTSSYAAIGYGHGSRTKPFDETDWTNLEGPGVGAYPKSKTIAERAAWDFIAREGGSLELAVVNPVGIFGPALGKDLAASMELTSYMLNGRMPGSPRIKTGLVDVRDVADLHLRAMVAPEARGERFLAVAGDFVWLRELAALLKERLGVKAKRVPTRQLPDWLVRVATLFDPALKLIVPELGKDQNASNAKARRLLGWKPRSNEEAAVASAESLVALGLVKS